MSELVDFTDLELISKRWTDLTQDSFPVEKQEIKAKILPNSSVGDGSMEEPKGKQTAISRLCENAKTRNPFPQIIDEDTENFRVKLDNLINIFKKDALAEFMSMKKFLLENQIKTIKNETERYLSMYEEKSSQLEKTNEKLAEKITENETLGKRVNELAGLCGKAKTRLRNQKVLGKCVQQLLMYKRQKAFKSKLSNLAKANREKRILISSLSTWKSNHLNSKLQGQKATLTEKFTEESNELVAKFNKEKELLMKRLQETQKVLDDINVSKEEMQENLKRAFMRGVCALNFEAMNILGEKKKEEGLVVQTNGLTNKLRDINENLNFNPLVINPIDQPLEGLPNKTEFSSIPYERNTNLLDKFDKSSLSSHESPENLAQISESQADDNQSVEEDPAVNSRKIMFFQAPKIESKDHKWREAPIVGINNFSESVKVQPFQNYKETLNPEILKKPPKKEEIQVLKEIENLPARIKPNVFMEAGEKDEGKVIMANLPMKKPLKKETENPQRRKTTVGTGSNLKKGKI